MVVLLVKFASEDWPDPAWPEGTDPRDRCCDHNNKSFCNGLTASQREKMKQISRVQEFPKDARIADEDGVADLVGNVVSGVLKLVKSLPDGRQQIVGLLLPSDMFGYASGQKNGFAIEAATDVTLCTFNRPRFETLLNEIPSLERNLASAIADEFESAREWLVLMSGRTVASRLAGFLLMLCHRWPRMACQFAEERRCLLILIPIGRQDMARYLGTTAESLSRTVQEFAKTGIIRLLSPSRFEVLDPGALIDKAGMPEFASADLIDRIDD